MSEQTAVLAKDLHVRLGRTSVLTGVDLQVHRGDLYGLLGRNGAGKTTSMRCLLGYQPFQKGQAQVFGQDARRIHLVQQAIGVALDPPGLDDTLTVKQNLELARIRGGIQIGRSVEEALELVGLSHRANHYGDRLSHGQGRRAAVARALLGKPELLVLDEPLSGLDPEGVETLIALFRYLSKDQGVTIMLSSHHLREVEDVCTRVGMIDSGRTILEGAVPELLLGAGDELKVVCRAAERVESILRKTRGIRAGTVRIDANRVSAQLDLECDLESLLKALTEQDCGVEEFFRERASLVDVFQNALATPEGVTSTPEVAA